ncbi:MAG: hypothetical protein SGPRY_005044 [Prymnesium sp.]
MTRVSGASPLAEEERAALEDREGAFSLFRSSYVVGKRRYDALRQANAALKEGVEAAQQVGSSLRASRDSIGSLKSRIEQHRISRAIASVVDVPGGGGARGGGEGEERLVDSEEMALCAQLQREKDSYRAQAEELKGLKLHCTALQARTQGLKAAFETDFSRWLPLARAKHGLPSSHPIERREDPAAASCQPAPSAEEIVTEGRGSARGVSGHSCGSCGVTEEEVTSSLSQGGGVTLALLEDPEAALHCFKQDFWEVGKASHREMLKERLNEAYATAKELGELITSKRASVAALKRDLAEGADSETEDRLRARLGHDTGLYKGAVSQLKEIKPEIEKLQSQLQLSQAVMHKDFEEWRQAAVARLKSTSGMKGNRICRDRTSNASTYESTYELH